MTQVKLEGECWTWNQRFIRGLGSIHNGANILSLDSLFSHSKASDANIGIIAILLHFEKKSNA